MELSEPASEMMVAADSSFECANEKRRRRDVFVGAASADNRQQSSGITQRTST